MRRTSLLAALMVAAASPAAHAEAAYPNQPFARDPVGIAQAAALLRLQARAEALAARGADDAEAAAGEDGASAALAEAEDADAAEPTDDAIDDAEAGEGPERDLFLVRASLAATAPAVAADLDRALTALAAPSDDDDAPAARLAGAVGRAAAALAPAGGDTPDRTAALIAALLLDEGGVAESYAAAVEGDAAAYAIGRAVLREVATLWTPLRAGTDPATAAELDAALSRLATLFPTATLPGELSADEDEAEQPAQQIVGLLEVATRADLYPGRDVGAALRMVERIAADGCARGAEGNADLAAERLAIAAAYYDRLLAPTLQFVAADPAASIAAAFSAPADAASEGCGALAAALGEARMAVAP